MADTDVLKKASLIGDWVAKVGVPAVIVFIMLFQTNKKIDALTEAIIRLSVVVESKR